MRETQTFDQCIDRLCVTCATCQALGEQEVAAYIERRYQPKCLKDDTDAPPSHIVPPRRAATIDPLAGDADRPAVRSQQPADEV